MALPLDRWVHIQEGSDVPEGTPTHVLLTNNTSTIWVVDMADGSATQTITVSGYAQFSLAQDFKTGMRYVVGERSASPYRTGWQVITHDAENDWSLGTVRLLNRYIANRCDYIPTTGQFSPWTGSVSINDGRCYMGVSRYGISVVVGYFKLDYSGVGSTTVTTNTDHEYWGIVPSTHGYPTSLSGEDYTPGSWSVGGNAANDKSTLYNFWSSDRALFASCTYYAEPPRGSYPSIVPFSSSWETAQPPIHVYSDDDDNPGTQYQVSGGLLHALGVCRENDTDEEDWLFAGLHLSYDASDEVDGATIQLYDKDGAVGSAVTVSTTDVTVADLEWGPDGSAYDGPLNLLSWNVGGDFTTEPRVLVKKIEDYITVDEEILDGDGDVTQKVPSRALTRAYVRHPDPHMFDTNTFAFSHRGTVYQVEGMERHSRDLWIATLSQVVS